jgi:hypothetical protein
MASRALVNALALKGASGILGNTISLGKLLAPGGFIYGKSLENVAKNALDVSRVGLGRSKLKADTRATRDYELRAAKMNEALGIADNAWFEDFASTNVKAIKYDSERSILTIMFWSGAIYDYYDVAEDTVLDFLNAESKGEWVWENIRGGAPGNDKYVYVRIS